MAEGADLFLASFNRIEKWLKDELSNPHNMGFSEMVRRVARQNLISHEASDDLLQMAQLRNSIVHEKIGEDFIIAEPNQWAVNRIEEIEKQLLKPEKVLPRFGKKVTGFEITLPLTEILKIIAEKKYSQFPIYDKGQFKGLISLRTLGYWFAKESQKGAIVLTNRSTADLLLTDGKNTNYHFVAKDTSIAEVRNTFEEEPMLEAVLITKDGQADGNLLGIIRPRDLFIEKIN